MIRQGYEFPVGWIVVTNGTSETIPPYGVVRITSVDQSSGLPVVGKPNADDDNAVFVNGGAPIPAGEKGSVHCTFPAIAAFQADSGDGANPANGEIWGTKSGSWYLHKWNKGFKILGTGGFGLCNVIRQNGVYPYADYDADGIVSTVNQKFGGNKVFGINAEGLYIASDSDFDPDNPSVYPDGYAKFGIEGGWSFTSHTAPTDYTETIVDMDASPVSGGVGRAVKITTNVVVSSSVTSTSSLLISHDGTNAVIKAEGDGVPRFVGSFFGNVTGNVSGNVTGNLTGNVTGNVTGDLTGDVDADQIDANNIDVAGGIDVVGVVSSGSFSGSFGYVATTAGDWAGGVAPTNVAAALDRCAALLKVLNGGTGP
jgi:hypothetical protein